MIKRWFGRTTEKLNPGVELFSQSDQSVSRAWSLLSLVNDWVKHAEAKLGVVFAFIGVLVAGFISLIIKFCDPSLLIIIFFFATAVFILMAGGSAVLGLVPRFRSKKKGDEIEEKREINLLFYADIFQKYEKREGDYCREAARLLDSDAELTRHILRQAFSNAGVAFQKYQWANRAILFGLIAGVGVMAIAFAYVFG